MTGRTADVYVFCVFSATERAAANPLDTDQWFFLICSSTFLNHKFSKQKSVSLASLEKKGLKRILFEDICTAIKNENPIIS